VGNVLKLVIVGRDSVCIRVDETKLVDSLLRRPQPEAPIEGTDSGERTIALTTRFGGTRGGTAVFPPDGAHPEPKPIPSLVRALVRARSWYIWPANYR